MPNTEILESTPDAIDRLPPAAAAKLLRLRAARDDATAAVRDTLGRLQDARLDHQRALGQLDRLLADPLSRRHPPPVVHHIARGAPPGEAGQPRKTAELAEPDDTESPQIRAARAAVERAEAEIARLEQHRRDLEARRWNGIRALETYLQGLVRSSRPITAHAEPASPRLGKGQTPPDAIATYRRRLQELQGEVAQIRARPRDKATLAPLARAEIEALARRGAPDLSGLIAGRGAIRWPERPVAVEVAGHVAAPGAPPIVAVAHGRAVDALAVLMWCYGEDIGDRVEAELLARLGDADGISDEDRQEIERRLLSTILETERAEEAIIEKIEANGGVFLRRANADPRAVLGLSGDLPAR